MHVPNPNNSVSRRQRSFRLPDRADTLLSELCTMTGYTQTQAVVVALEMLHRLEQHRRLSARG